MPLNITHPLPTNLMDDCTGLQHGVIYCYSRWANTVTDGIFWTLLLLGFVIVLFISTIRFGTPRAIGFASVVGLFGATWLATMQLVPWMWASLFILGGAIGIAMMFLMEK